MSKVIAVISADDDLLTKHVHALRDKGQTARGLSARLWNDADEPAISAWHVVAATDAEATALAKRIEAVSDVEVVKIVAKAKPAAKDEKPAAKDEKPAAKDEKPAA